MTSLVTLNCLQALDEEPLIFGCEGLDVAAYTQLVDHVVDSFALLNGETRNA